MTPRERKTLNALAKALRDLKTRGFVTGDLTEFERLMQAADDALELVDTLDAPQSDTEVAHG